MQARFLFLRAKNSTLFLWKMTGIGLSPGGADPRPIIGSIHPRLFVHPDDQLVTRYDHPLADTDRRETFGTHELISVGLGNSENLTDLKRLQGNGKFIKAVSSRSHRTSLSAEFPSAACMSNTFCILCAVCAICTIFCRAEGYRTYRTDRTALMPAQRCPAPGDGAASCCPPGFSCRRNRIASPKALRQRLRFLPRSWAGASSPGLYVTGYQTVP